MKKIKIKIVEGAECGPCGDPLPPRNEKHLEEAKNCGCGQDPCVTYGKVQESIDGNATIVKAMIGNLNVDELEQEQLESLYNLLKSFPSSQ